MNRATFPVLTCLLAFFLLLLPILSDGQEKKEPDRKFPPFGKGPGMMGQTQKIVARFDRDGDKRLNNEERKEAREFLKKDRPGGRPGFGPPKFGFGPGGFLAKALLDGLDSDKDGKLSTIEVEAGIKALIQKADRKKDAIDAEKLAEILDEFFPKPKDGPFVPKGGLGFSPAKPLAGNILKQADTDGDGAASQKELLVAAQALVKEHDRNRDGKLDETEAGASIGQLLPGPGMGKFGPPKGPGFGREKLDPPKPGPRVSPTEVKIYPDAPLYEPTVLRTLFFEFENKDWEAELQDFIRTDVEVPATLIVDGKKYPNVGVHFRGMSSLMGVGAGYKRSLAVAIDFVDEKQRLHGYRTLNLLNSNGDPSLMSTVLYSHLARKHIPAPRANFVKVVINGESWGIYCNVQQFNKDFLAENFKTQKGTRWKVKGSPGADAGLNYIGDNVEEYKRRYEIKSKDDPKAWNALIHLCKVLSTTPIEKLETELESILDIDGALWFLALDVALINSDGYWVRASDYYLYLDPRGKFHVIPHDMNEAFQPGFGPGTFPGFGKGRDKVPFGKDGGAKGGERKGGDGKGPGPGKGRGGIELDPLVGLDDLRKPLRGRLLQVPALKARYLDHVRAIAEDLDWKTLGTVVGDYRKLIEKEVELDTRKLSSLESFRRSVADTAAEPGGPGRMSLRSFADQRRTYLLGHPAIKSVTDRK